MRHLLVLAVLLVTIQASAQLINEEAWLEGAIVLSDGTKDNGQVRYNDRTGVVSFASANKSASYNARNLVGFEFKDTEKIKRQFYSLHYQSPYNNSVVRQFFEVLREYRDFAVISRTAAFGEKTPVEVTTVYLVKASDLMIHPFMQVMEREVKWKLFDANKSQYRVLNSKLPKEIMGENFPKVKSFAKERKLQWHVKDSLIAILDYYDSLVK